MTFDKKFFKKTVSQKHIVNLLFGRVQRVANEIAIFLQQIHFSAFFTVENGIFNDFWERYNFLNFNTVFQYSGVYSFTLKINVIRAEQQKLNIKFFGNVKHCTNSVLRFPNIFI